MVTLTFACLDTAFLVDFLRGVDKAQEQYLRLKSEGFHFASTSVNAFELFRGCDVRGRVPSEEQAVRRLLSRIIIWNLDVEAADRASRIYTELERSGKPIGVNDCLTAAIAFTNGCSTIITQDRHYERIVGIDVRRY